MIQEMQSLLAFQGAVSFVSLTQKLFRSGWRVREKERGSKDKVKFGYEGGEGAGTERK